MLMKRKLTARNITRRCMDQLCGFMDHLCGFMDHLWGFMGHLCGFMDHLCGFMGHFLLLRLRMMVFNLLLANLVLYDSVSLAVNDMSAAWSRGLKRCFYGDRVIATAWSRFNCHPHRTRCCVLR